MGLIPEEIIAQVLDRSDIVQTISSYLPLKKAGRNFKAHCPFHHEKTPSFVVNPDKQIFHCFGCGVGGNSVTFVMKQENLVFPEAVRLMADKVGIVIPESDHQSSETKSFRQEVYHVNSLTADFYHHVLISDKGKEVSQARDYLKARGVNLEIVKKFSFGFAPNRWDGLLLYLRKKDISLSLMEKAGLIVAQERQEGFYDRFRNRIIFPIFDIKARCVGLGARTLTEGMAKYINSPETIVYTKGNHLFGFHVSKESIGRQDQAIVVEGYMDFVMPFQMGVQNIVASLGTSLTVEQIRVLRRFTKNIVMLFDTDQAGESATLRSLDVLIEQGINVRVATLDKGEDPDSFIRRFGPEVFAQRIKEAKSLFDYKFDVLLKQHDKKSVEGRAKISIEVLTTISKFDNAVVRSEYIKQVSQALKISQEALLIEFKKLSVSKFNKGHNANDVPKKAIDQKSRSAEYGVLRIILENQNLISTTKKEIELSDLQDENVREIISKIYDMYDKDQNCTVANLMSSFDDQKILQIISSLLTSEEKTLDNVDKMHQDCVNRIIDDRIRLQRQDLVDQIQQAEMAGEEHKLDELKEKFNQLIRK